MRKFARPEMEVVRFTEEDVIVASGDPRSFTVSGLRDDTLGNSKIVYMGKEYSLRNPNDLFSAIEGNGLHAQYNKGENFYPITFFIDPFEDYFEHLSADDNGVWIYDSSINTPFGNGAFIKQ